MSNLPKAYVGERAVGPYLWLIRYLMQRPALIEEFTALPPKYVSVEAQALALMLGYLRHNAITNPSPTQILQALAGSEFEGIYRHVASLILELGNTGEDSADFRDALMRYRFFEGRVATLTNLGIDAAKAAGIPDVPDKPPLTPPPEDDAFLRSYEWRRVRMFVLKRDGAKCRCCGATPKTGAVMNVDHIKPRRIYPELALDPKNLQVLCNECNHGKGNWDMTDWRATDRAS